MCYENHYRDKTLKTILQFFYIKFLNSDISVDKALNVTKLIGYLLCILLEGSVSQNFDLGPGYFLMLCRKLVKVIFHIILCLMS